MGFNSKKSLLAAVVVGSLGAAATAAPVNYGDFSDVPPGSVMYLDVTESSGTNAASLYGSPSAFGNILDFDPSTFTASAADGNSELTDGQLNFVIMAIPGNAINKISVVEGGDYSMFGTGSVATQVAAALSISIDILEVDGVAVGPPNEGGLSVNYFDSFTGFPQLLDTWSLSEELDLDAVLTANNISFNFGVTKAELVINNQLIAISEDLSTAFIAKKDFRIDAETSVVPEPTSLALIGLGGLALMRRRRA